MTASSAVLAPPARLGVHATSLADHRLTPAGAVALAARHGFTACLFNSVFDVSPRLDAGEITGLAALAADLGVTVTVGSVSLHPFRASTDRRLLVAGDGDALAGLRRMLQASALLPDRDLLTIIGRIEDRYDRLVPWSEQLRAAGDLLGRLAPLLRDSGIRLAVKTHEEITRAEAARLVDAAGDDVAGVALDPVNLLVNLDDPVRTGRELAGVVTQVIVDDAVLIATDGAVRRLLCPVGEGIVDWPGVRAAIGGRQPTWWVELHRGQFTLAPFDVDWIFHHPDLTREELGAGVRHVLAATRRLDAGRIRRLSAAQACPAGRLAATTAATRELLTLPSGPTASFGVRTSNNRSTSD